MRKYFAITKINLINSLVYPQDLISRSSMILLFMWIFFQLWRVVYQRSESGLLSGLTLNNAMWYFLIAETLELGRPRSSRMISEQVKDGGIAYIINKPYNFLLYQLSSGIGDSLPRMAMLFILGGSVVWIMAGSPPPVEYWPAAFLALCLAWLLHFEVNALIGLSAFIVEEVAPFEWIYQKFVFVLGGMLIPLDFFPSWLQSISKLLPFSYMMYGPARLFVSPEKNILTPIVIGQLFWLLVLGCALLIFYSHCTRRLSINGG